MQTYDPDTDPDPDDWLALDEGERLALVQDHHRRAKHAGIHVIVENQVAEGDALPVQRTLRRLQAEGLDRHDAVHAIGSVLARHMQDLMVNGTGGEEPNAAYGADLEELSAESWQSS